MEHLTDRAQTNRIEKLMFRCLEGLTEYARELKHQAESQEKIQYVRDFIDGLSCYWGLDGEYDPLDYFDERMNWQKIGFPLLPADQQVKEDTLRGLSLYARDMIDSHGWSRREDILNIRCFMREIGAIWHMEPRFFKVLCAPIDRQLRQWTEEQIGNRIKM